MQAPESLLVSELSGASVIGLCHQPEGPRLSSWAMTLLLNEVVHVRRAPHGESPRSGYDSDASLDAFDLSEGPDTEGGSLRPP